MFAGLDFYFLHLEFSWMGKVAEQLGVDVLSGFGGSEVLYEGEKVVGVATSDVGVDKNGNKTVLFFFLLHTHVFQPAYSPGVELRGRLNVFAEGCRGQLSEQLISKFKLDRYSKATQSYGLGIKEV